MVKSMQIQQPPPQNPVAVEENVSNLTSASGEASASSGNRAETGLIYPPHHQYLNPPSQTQQALKKKKKKKKKRNLPGNPDPEAEVIALSPKTLMATNRFLCEICSKGFQRDQNLQLHRRGHNLPWKLKQRTSKDIKKKVYVCPEPGCVHNDPSRALGDLTGIKKHFSRKHGEKKWKCDKCSKRYAVQSDWKAHSKTCGTREYRCDCGTLFSRRDSFITHRAFCDALAEESARAMTVNPLLLSQAGTPREPQFVNSHGGGFPVKKEPQNFNPRPENIPSWLACQGPPPPSLDLTTTSVFSPRLVDQDGFTVVHDHENPISPNPSLGPSLQAYYHPTASLNLSATALLQKAAQMGATMSSSSSSSKNCPSVGAHQGNHVPADSGNYTTGSGLNLSSREERGSGIAHPLAPRSGNKAKAATPPPPPTTTTTTAGCTVSAAGAGAPSPPCPSLLQEMMTSLSSANANGFVVGSSFEDSFGHGGMLNSKILNHHHHHGSEGLTRDFLGLRPLSYSDILSMAGLSSTNAHEKNQNQIN